MWDIPDGALIVSNDGEVVAFVNPDVYYDIFLGLVPAGSLILDGHAVYVNY